MTMINRFGGNLLKTINSNKMADKNPGIDIRQKKDTGLEGGLQLPEAPSFLIILMGSLGDVTRGLYLVSRIKARFPQAVITWLIEPKCREIVTVHPLIDEILVFNRTNWQQGGLKDILFELRKRHFDCVLDLQRHVKSGFFSFATGAKYRIGFHRSNAKEGNWLFNNTFIPPMDESYPKIFHYLKFTELLGCHPEYEPAQSRALFESRALDSGLSGSALSSAADDILAAIKTPYMAVVLGSSWISKEWHFEGYTALINTILDTTELNVVLVDTMAKYQMACELEREIDSTRLINLVGKTSLPELAAVLQQAEVAVGPDCGSAHIAAAVGTYYVTIFGPTDPVRTAPFGSEHLVVSKNLACAPCYKRKCPQKEPACLNNITAGDVLQKILQVLH